VTRWRSTNGNCGHWKQFRATTEKALNDGLESAARGVGTTMRERWDTIAETSSVQACFGASERAPNFVRSRTVTCYMIDANDNVPRG